MDKKMACHFRKQLKPWWRRWFSKEKYEWVFDFEEFENMISESVWPGSEMVFNNGYVKIVSMVDTNGNITTITEDVVIEDVPDDGTWSIEKEKQT